MKVNRIFLTVAAFILCIAALNTTKAQTDTLVTMKSSATEVGIQLNWTPTTAVVKVNNVVVSRNTRDTISVNGDGSVFITTDNNAVLTELYCSENQLTKLDVSKNTALERLHCQHNQLTGKLDVSKNTALRFLNCYYNQLDSLDFSNCTALRGLECDNNQLKGELDVSKNTKLTNLHCQYNQLTALDFSNCTALISLQCYHNQLKGELDVFNDTALTDLNCSNNQLTKLNVSNNTLLKILSCQNNQLTALDVSKNTALTSLYCNNNQLSSLDLSKNTLLTSLDARNQAVKAYIRLGDAAFANPIYYHNLTNVENAKISGTARAFGVSITIPTAPKDTLHFTTNKTITDGNPFGGVITIEIRRDTLVIIKKDKMSKSPFYAEFTGEGTIKANNTDLYNNGYSSNITPNSDSSIIISTTGDIVLTLLDVSESDIAELNVSQAIHLTMLGCQNNSLTALDVSNNTALIALNCSDNNITALNVSNNTALEELECELNQLTALDVSNNTALVRLGCGYNKLTALDISNNTALELLMCSNNHLPRFDISSNTALKWLYAESQQIEVPILPGATTFRNPLFYNTLTGEDTVQIEGEWYFYQDEISKTKDTMAFITNLPAIVEYGNAFDGIITFVSGTSIVETQSLASSVQVYPNPAQNELTIENGETEFGVSQLRIESVAIFDICGKLLNNYQLSNGNSQSKIDISHLANGIYLIKVKTAQGETVKKIVKQ